MDPKPHPHIPSSRESELLRELAATANDRGWTFIGGLEVIGNEGQPQIFTQVAGRRDLIMCAIAGVTAHAVIAQPIDTRRTFMNELIATLIELSEAPLMTMPTPESMT